MEILVLNMFLYKIEFVVHSRVQKKPFMPYYEKNTLFKTDTEITCDRQNIQLIFSIKGLIVFPERVRDSHVI